MRELEHKEQVMLIDWWRLACRGLGIPESCLFAIPNGGERNVVVAAKLKAEGVRAGVPDLFLAVPRGGFSGLFIELKKSKGGRVSFAQKAAMAELAAQGYRATVAHGWIEAKEALEGYLGLRGSV